MKIVWEEERERERERERRGQYQIPHEKHSDDPSGEFVPLSHSTHAVAPGREENVFSAHKTH